MAIFAVPPALDCRAQTGTCLTSRLCSSAISSTQISLHAMALASDTSGHSEPLPPFPATLQLPPLAFPTCRL